MTDDKEEERLRLVHNEQVNIRATFSAGLIAIGSIAVPSAFLRPEEFPDSGTI
jgi:hypothetical protein